MKMHEMRLKAFIQPHIASGRKDIEVRVADSKRRQIEVGDTIIFRVSFSDYGRRVKAIRTYTSFEALLEAESPSRIMPNWSTEGILLKLRELFPPDKEALGVLAIELETVT